MRASRKRKLEKWKGVSAEKKPFWRGPTKILLVVVGLGLVLYDFLPFLDPARHDTISEVVAEYSLRLFTLPMVFGALMGHFFFLRDGTRPKPYITLPVLALFIAADVATYLTGLQALEWARSYPAAWFIVGIPLGALFWPQTKSDKR